MKPSNTEYSVSNGKKQELPVYEINLQLRCDTGEWERIREEILKLELPKKQLLRLCLAAEERFVDICSYAYGDHPTGDEPIEFFLRCSDRVEMEFSDCGSPFDPTGAIADLATYDPDTQIGGLGNLLSHDLTDEMRYRYENGKNITTLVKYLSSGDRTG